jgi:hypothetical protein
MEGLARFVSSGHIVDLILIVIVIEAAVLLWWRGRRSVGAIVSALLPGVLLLLALRAALMDAPWLCVAGTLALAFPAHLFDLWRRPVGPRR